MGIPKGREFRKRWGITIALVNFVWAPVFVVLAIVVDANHHPDTVLSSSFFRLSAKNGRLIAAMNRAVRGMSMVTVPSPSQNVC